MLLQAEDLQVQVVEQLHLLLLQESDVPLHALDLVLQGHGLHRNQIPGPGLQGVEVAGDQTAVCWAASPSPGALVRGRAPQEVQAGASPPQPSPRGL